MTTQLHPDDSLVGDDLPGYIYKRNDSGMWWMYFSRNGKTIRLSTKRRHKDAAEAVWRQTAAELQRGADSTAALRATLSANGRWSAQWDEMVKSGMQPGEWADLVYQNSVRSSKPRNLDHDLTRMEFQDLLEASGGECQVTGIRFDFTTKVGRIRPWMASLDRIDSAKGYTLSNVRIICCVVNLALSHWGDEVLERIAVGMLVKKHLR